MTGDVHDPFADGDPDTQRVADHMSDTLITAAPEWSLERAAVEMAERAMSVGSMAHGRNR